MHGIKYRSKDCNRDIDAIKAEYLAYARERCRDLQAGSVELLAYRKALGVPSAFTREEAAAETKTIVQIID